MNRVLCSVHDPHRTLVWNVRPRLAHIVLLGLFAAGLALQSLHLGHDIFVEEHAECECVAIDRQEGAFHLLSTAFDASGMVVAASTSTVDAPTRDPDIHYGARAPPSA